MSDNLRDQLTSAYDSNLEDPQVEQGEDAPFDKAAETEHLQDTSTEPNDNAQEETEEEFKAPEHWASEDKEVFVSLDKRGREFLLRRHKEMESAHTKKQQALADERKQVDSLIKAVEPHQDYLQRIGISKEDAVSKLLATARRLEESNAQEKTEIFHKLAQEYGVQLPQEAGEPLSQEAQLLYDEINRVKAESQKIKEAQTRFDDERKLEGRRSIENKISDFASQKDDRGNLMHPHFDALRDQMAKLLNGGLAGNLEEAYESAIYLHSDLRKNYNSRHTNNEKQEADVRQKTLASKRAGFNVKSGASAQISDPKEDLSLRATLERNIEAYFRP